MNRTGSTYWRSLAGGISNDPADRLLLAVLVPFSLIYAQIQRVRALFYHSGIFQIRKLPRPVISIGNITVGGTGKTPVTAYLARYLLAKGLKVAILTRGYGGTREGQTAVVSDGRQLFMSVAECGDEPYLLATTIPGVMVIMGSDRHAAGLLAMEQLAPDVFLLDDGYQHLRLHRDLDILLLDWTRPYGNGWTLPAGLLREPRSAADRSDLVILTRCPEGAGEVPAVKGKTTLRSRHELGTMAFLSGDRTVEAEVLQRKKIVAFCGIAMPDSFFAGLRELGLDLVQTLAFPDHAPYDDTRLAVIAAALHSSGADYAITTGKDAVKIQRLPDALASRILTAPLDLVIDNAPLLHTLLDRVLPPR
jgi:tetraacyldisaccharide 4'-kinase